jgi:copper(I)-binding protein
MRIILAFMLALIMAAPAFAGSITIERASVIGVTGATAGGVSMVIVNAGADDKLTAVKIDTGTAQLNTTSVNEKGFIIAKKTDAIAIPGNGKTTVLNAAGDYISISGLAKALSVGSKIPVSLTFEKSGTQAIDIEVVTIEEFMKRFPPEILGGNLLKSREIREANAPDSKKTWGQRLRDKIRTLGRKEAGLPDDTMMPMPSPPSGAADALPPMPAGMQLPPPPALAGPMSTPDNPLPPEMGVPDKTPAVTIESAPSAPAQ